MLSIGIELLRETELNKEMVIVINYLNLQKQPPRGAPRRRSFEKPTLLKSLFGMGVNLLHIFGLPSPKNTSG